MRVSVETPPGFKRKVGGQVNGLDAVVADGETSDLTRQLLLRMERRTIKDMNAITFRAGGEKLFDMIKEM